MATNTTKPLKPIKTVRASTVRSALRREVRAFERRYEMPTERMRDLIACDLHVETAEIARWLHEANVLAVLEERSMAGSGSAAIRKSTNGH